MALRREDGEVYKTQAYGSRAGRYGDDRNKRVYYYFMGKGLFKNIKSKYGLNNKITVKIYKVH